MASTRSSFGPGTLGVAWTAPSCPHARQPHPGVRQPRCRPDPLLGGRCQREVLDRVVEPTGGGSQEAEGPVDRADAHRRCLVAVARRPSHDPGERQPRCRFAQRRATWARRVTDGAKSFRGTAAGGVAGQAIEDPRRPELVAGPDRQHRSQAREDGAGPALGRPRTGGCRRSPRVEDLRMHADLDRPVDERNRGPPGAVSRPAVTPPGTTGSTWPTPPRSSTSRAAWGLRPRCSRRSMPSRPTGRRSPPACSCRSTPCGTTSGPCSTRSGSPAVRSSWRTCSPSTTASGRTPTSCTSAPGVHASAELACPHGYRKVTTVPTRGARPVTEH